jgi:hypothetical protein
MEQLHTVNVNLPMSASAKSYVPVLVSMMISQHLREEVTSAHDPMEYDRGLTVVQAQLVQRVQSLLLDLLLEDSLSIDHMLSRYGQSSEFLDQDCGWVQLDTSQNHSHQTLWYKWCGSSRPHSLGCLLLSACLCPGSVYQAYQCTDFWRQDNVVTVSEISQHLKWSELVKLGRELMEGTLKSLLIFLLWIDHLTDL